MKSCNPFNARIKAADEELKECAMALIALNPNNLSDTTYSGFMTKTQLFCHQPECTAFGKQIQNIGWASKTGERNAYRCRICGTQWSQIHISLLKVDQNPQIQYDVQRKIEGHARSKGYRHDKRKGGCGLYKRKDLAEQAGEAVCICLPKKSRTCGPTMTQGPIPRRAVTWQHTTIFPYAAAAATRVMQG